MYKVIATKKVGEEYVAAFEPVVCDDYEIITHNGITEAILSLNGKHICLVQVKEGERQDSDPRRCTRLEVYDDVDPVTDGPDGPVTHHTEGALKLAYEVGEQPFVRDEGLAIVEEEEVSEQDAAHAELITFLDTEIAEDTDIGAKFKEGFRDRIVAAIEEGQITTEDGVVIALEAEEEE